MARGIHATAICPDGDEAHLLDAHAALVDEWPASIAFRLPEAPERQFQGKSQKTKTSQASQADMDGEAYHEELLGWLGAAIDAVRSEWLCKNKLSDRWCMRKLEGRISSTEGAGHDAVDLHAWCAVCQDVSKPDMPVQGRPSP